MILLQTILYKPSFRNEYWMKDGDNKSKKIRKEKWFELFDLPDSKVLAPLTKEKKDV